MDSGTPASMPEATLASDDEPELTAGESVRSSTTRALPERRELGHYILLEELGRGGMGVVYAARDRKLNRKVAIKMLRRDGDAKLQRRLIREAQAMAKLVHPSVVTVHEIGEHEGSTFIVMEYVEGQTLRQWLTAQPRSVAEILAAFMAAGRGLAAIHEAGLIHRDFKPDNSMIRVGGQVLVMDLGIARDGAGLALATASPEGLDDAPVDLTRDGTLMGSPAYMAAEQFSAAEVTSKTDQFSFCVSLWEALYGERPFAGETMMALIDAVSTGRMRASKRSDVPLALRSVLERGLQVDPQARFDSMTALLGALETASGSRKRTRARLAWGAAVVVALGSAFVGVRVALDRATATAAATAPDATPSEPAPPKPTGPAEHRQISTSGTATKPALSPDGEHVVFVDNGGFVHVDLRSGATKPLAPQVSDVLGTNLANDGSLMFNARLHGEVGLYRMASLDAAPVRIPDALEIFCRFADRDLIASFEVDDKHVKLTKANGSLVAELPVEGEYEWMRDVACDPRNDRVAVLHMLGTTSTLKLIDLDGGPQRVLFESSVGLSSPHFDATGETLYYLAARDGQTNLEAIGIAVNDKLPVTRVVVPNIDATAFSRADSGRVAYARTRTVHRDIWRIGATDSSLERAERIVQTDAEELLFAVSPDQTELVYVESRRNLGRLMIRSLTDGSARELTRGDRLRYPVWSPDGQTIAFVALYRGQTHVWTVPAAGGMPKVFKRALASDEPPIAWAPGERILYERPENRNFALLDPISEDERPLLATADEVGWPFFPAVSPDGDSVAVLWSRDPIGLWRIDIEHGTPSLVASGEYYPITWSADGRFIYAERPDNSAVKLYRVPAAPAGTDERSATLEPWRTVDFGPRRDGSCAVLSSEELLCGVTETAADIWIAEATE
jgi:tRNA A-37 threonylcarbamoyl transferase component Bud32/Tol biopolymer transport system component